MAGISSAGMADVWAIKRAAKNAPMTFALSTMPHKTATRRNKLAERSCTTGNTVVIVFSVKSCMRPRITARNPKL